MFEDLDPLIDCIDSCQAETRVCRRASLAHCLGKNGLVLVTQKAINYASQAAKFFDDVPMLEWLDRVWPSQRHDTEERALRFGEEALELLQAEGITREQMHALVDQVCDKPVGETEQELGGTLVTLSAYMAVKELDGVDCFHKEFNRCNERDVIARIQAKHKNKLVVSSKQR